MVDFGVDESYGFYEMTLAIRRATDRETILSRFNVVGRKIRNRSPRSERFYF